MRHTLVTFLGRGAGRHSSGNTPPSYREAVYQFPDGKRRKTAFFGLELANYLANSVYPKPDCLVIMGTSGSQWSVLVEEIAENDEHWNDRCILETAQSQQTEQTVDQKLLDRLKKLMSRYVGMEVRPCLIPYARDPEEQREILSQIAETVPDGKVSFDLTHGFRHLGVIGFLSAFMLKQIRQLEIRNIWYGALDMQKDKDSVAPVIKLDGLVQVGHWVEALNRFDATGDYGVFEQLLIEDEIAEDKAKCLREAAYYERIFNVKDAVRKLGTFLPELGKEIKGPSRLFRQNLIERLEWAKTGCLSDHQMKLAFEYLNRSDFVRSAIFAWEGIITKECDSYGFNPEDYSTDGGRDQAKKHLERRLRKEKDKKEAFRWIRDLRNSLAHGQASKNTKVVSALRKPEKFGNLLKLKLEEIQTFWK